MSQLLRFSENYLDKLEVRNELPNECFNSLFKHYSIGENLLLFFFIFNELITDSYYQFMRLNAY